MCLLQSLCVFSLNFVCFYTAVQYIHSGLESVIFSMAVFFNALFAWLFFKQKPSRQLIPAALLGLAGMVLLFWQEWNWQNGDMGQLKGVALSLLGTLGFSLGNMLSLRHQRHGLDVFSSNAYAMMYGVVVLWFLAKITGTTLQVPWQEMTFTWSLLYLAIFGSVIGFTAYFSLVKRLGAARSAYATLLFPLVALGISTVWEGYQWHVTAIVGMILILMGNLWMFKKP
ncbi:putative EamA-like transporter [Vitreoscilla sp. C1]|nr:putative EamA-like transporter [Vitreoscilla sp. C1]